MRRSHRSRLVLPLLLLASSLASAPAIAAWAPDSMLTLGSGGSYALTWGAILPAGGGDLYAIWHFSPSVSAYSGVSRVTADGGLVFTGYQDYRTPPQGSALDGSGGVLEAYPVGISSNNFDIAYRRTSSSGAAQPAVSNYWAAQTPAFDQDPGVASDAASGAYIGWWSFSSNFTYSLQRVTAAGATAPGWSSQGRLMSMPASSSNAAAPSLLPDGSGGVYVLAAADYIRVWRVQADATNAPGWSDGGVALSAIPNAYGGKESPSDLALVPGPAGHTFAAWLENDGTHNNSNSRVAVGRFGDAGGVDGPVLALTTFTSGISSLTGQGDNQGGLLLSWYQSGTGYFVAHVLADGTVAAGPIQVTGGILAAGRNGGFIAFGVDSMSFSIRAQWFLADGTPDPGEPQNPRLAYGQQTPYPQRVYPLAAYTDGDGGAYLLFNFGGQYIYPPLPAEARMMHVLRTGALAVGPPPRPHALALALSPNPARSELSLDLVLTGNGQVTLEVLDVNGRRVVTRSIEAGPGSRRERLALPAGLAPGVYLVRVREGAAEQMRRFALVR